MGENLIRNIFTILKYLPTNYLSHYKEKNSSFIAEKPDIETVTKWSKLISPIQELTNMCVSNMVIEKDTPSVLWYS